MSANRDQDEACTDAGVRSDEAHGVRLLHYRPGVEDLDASLLEVGAVDALETGDLPILVAD
jgi:hypothetical protein